MGLGERTAGSSRTSVFLRDNIPMHYKWELALIMVLPDESDLGGFLVYPLRWPSRPDVRVGSMVGK